MKLNYKNFEIEVFDGPNYILNSVDNLRPYEKVYFLNLNQEDTTKHTIIIKESGNEISNAKIYGVGKFSGIFDNSFILEDDKLWILSQYKVYCLNIPYLELLWQKEFDLHANISIYKLEEDILIHGELEIFRITKEGNIIWSFGGRDIWVNIEGKMELSFENNTIQLFDFVSNEYILDFNENQIEDNPRIISKEIKSKWWKIFG